MKALRWTLRLVGGAAALVALVYGVGMLLPVEHRTSVQRRVAGSPDEAWAAITDVEASSEWRGDVDRVELLPSEGVGVLWREWGGEAPLTFELVESTPPERWVARIADEDLPFGGRWIYELAGGRDSTTVTITEEGEIRDPLFRFFARFVFGYEATATRYLDDLEAHMEGRRAAAPGVGDRPPDGRGRGPAGGSGS